MRSVEKVDSRVGTYFESQKSGNASSIGRVPKHVQRSILDGLYSLSRSLLVSMKG